MADRETGALVRAGVAAPERWSRPDEVRDNARRVAGQLSARSQACRRRRQDARCDTRKRERRSSAASCRNSSAAAVSSRSRQTSGFRAAGVAGRRPRASTTVCSACGAGKHGSLVGPSICKRIGDCSYGRDRRRRAGGFAIGSRLRGCRGVVAGLRPTGKSQDPARTIVLAERGDPSAVTSPLIGVAFSRSGPRAASRRTGLAPSR